jgi:hypothetical protein
VKPAWGAGAGVPHCHPHLFRHAFATMLLDQGADLRLVQGLMDYEDPRSTAIYTCLADELRLPNFGAESQDGLLCPTKMVAYRRPVTRRKNEKTTRGGL